jgi:hypothetical protein
VGERHPRRADDEPVRVRVAAKRVLPVADCLHVGVVGELHHAPPVAFQKV